MLGIFLNMYVNCPSCTVRFIILESQINKNTKKLKCSKCGHIWQADFNLASDNLVIPEVPKMPTMSKIKDMVGSDEESGANIKINNHSILSSLYLTNFLFFLIASCFAFLYFYKSVDINRYLRVGDIRVDCTSEKNIILKYKIFNDAETKIMLPKVRIRLKNKDNTYIKTHILQDRIDIRPTSYVNIKTELFATEDVDKIDISIGKDINFLVW